MSSMRSSLTRIAPACLPTISYLALLNLGGRAALAVGADPGIAQCAGQIASLAGIALLWRSGICSTGRIGRPSAGTALAAAGVGVLMQAASSLFILTVGGFGDSPVSEYVFGAAGAVSSVLLAPLVEEITFRGFTQAGFKDLAGRRWGIVSQAVLFATCHTEPVQMVYSFVCGLALGELAEREGIWASAAAHAVCNALGVLSAVLG